MDFLDYKRVIEGLARLDVTERQDGEGVDSTLALTIEHEECRLLIIGPGATTDRLPGAHAAVDPGTSVSEAAESVLGLMHTSESIVIPVRQWRAILDVAAFELAQHERWLDIDHEATLHQNTRDPLAVLPADKHLVRTLISACVEHGEDETTNLIVTSLDTPLVLEARHDGFLHVQCMTPAVMDNIVQGFSR